MSADQWNFRAWEGGLSLIGLADHFAATSGRVPAMLRSEVPAPDASANATLVEGQARLTASTEQLFTLLDHLNDEALSREVTVFGGARMTVDGLMDIVLAHEAHQKGQIWVMARLLGLQPPRYFHQG